MMEFVDSGLARWHYLASGAYLHCMTRGPQPINVGDTYEYSVLWSNKIVDYPLGSSSVARE
jgi:hypothetical protein